MKRLACLAVAGLLGAACQSDRAMGPGGVNLDAAGFGSLEDRAGHYNLPAPGSDGLRVMTYNVYPGTNFGAVLAAQTPEQLLLATAQAYALLKATNFPARAGKIADQIAEAQPDLVGLDEAALWSTSSPYDPSQPPIAPFEVQYDAVQLVIDSLAARGLTYVAASEVFTSDVFAPAPTEFDGSGNPTAFALVHFQDRDAILVRTGVSFTDARHGVYEAYIPLNVLGTETGLYNGWCSVRATVNGRAFRFVNSHLNAEAWQINYLQAKELLDTLQAVGDPVVWVGDFNSGPGVSDDFMLAYNLVTASGFSDLWLMAHPRDPGLTNGSTESVLVPSLVFDKRIDLVMVRDPGGPPEAAHASIFGDLPDDRVAPDFWPSDHAAVAAVFKLPTP